MTDRKHVAPDITPTTRIGALLDAFPDLEEVLIETAPVFKKLKNPVLRRTVAKVATIERAAGIAGIPVRDLVITLRTAAGLAVDAQALPTDSEPAMTSAPAPTPAWLQEGALVEEFNADAMLDAGEVPLGPIVRRARALQPGEMLRVVSAFRPTPLVDKLTGLGHPVHTTHNQHAGFHTHVGSTSASGDKSA